MKETWEMLDNSVSLGNGFEGRLFRQTMDFGEPAKKIVIYHVLRSVASWNEKNAVTKEASP